MGPFGMNPPGQTLRPGRFIPADSNYEPLPRLLSAALTTNNKFKETL